MLFGVRRVGLLETVVGERNVNLLVVDDFGKGKREMGLVVGLFLDE